MKTRGTGMSESTAQSSPFDPASITRPDPALRTYYILCAACTVFGFPIVIWPLMFKYHTLKYTFDDKGVSMSWGVLFHREIYLTYRRIQDIHVTRNLFHRWLGLAAVAVQTASGSSGAEMTIEGIRNPEALRDFLYQPMRGARGDAEIVESEGASVQSSPATTQDDEALILLRDIRDELRAQRERIQHGDHGVHRAESE
jgi:putative membrane protein